MLRTKNSQMLRNEVQVDKTYIGGRETNKHKSKRQHYKQGYKSDKTTIIRLVEKGGNVVTQVLPWVTKKNIGALIRSVIEKDSIMVTDSHRLYKHLSKSDEYKHEKVYHELEQYVNEKGFHTNTIEGFSSIVYRYNSRKITDDERFENSIKNSTGRLYKQLIDKHC